MPTKKKICFLASTIGISCVMLFMSYYWTNTFLFETSMKRSHYCNGIATRDTITPLQNNQIFVIAPYYDNREENLIRILGIIHHEEVKELYCYFCCSLYNYTFVSKALIAVHDDRFGFPYGLADIICPEPARCKPKYMSLHWSPIGDVIQQPKFKIQNLEPRELSSVFTVCISTMFGNYTNVLQFIQTIEMYKLLGAQKVMIYLHSCSPQMHKVLQYYSKEGILEIIPWPIDKYLKPSTKWFCDNNNTHIGYYGQISTLNDCVYRNMYTSKFVLLNDLDEIILPFKHKDWNSMMSTLQMQNPEVGIFLFENHIFPNTIFSYGNFSDMSMWKDVPGNNILQHIHREPDRPNYFNARKMIVNPRKVVQTSVHSVLKHYGSSKEVSIDTALVYHCRGRLQANLSEESLIEDKTLWRYSIPLIRNVNEVLNQNMFLMTTT
ncbi:beta-1,4-galactosyltransferase galt-1-like [Discoglossus pictus]